MSDLLAWQIVCGEVIILVPACDVDWANVGVGLLDGYRRHQRGGQAQYRVSVPDLRRAYRPRYYTEMPPETYDHYLRLYRAEILALIERLNAA